ncbi:MAG: DNA-formamidopyrimidine glycosylase family protein [Mycobacterium sp.]
MPELPDVEGFRRDLTLSLPGRRVRDVDVADAGVLRNTTARSLAKALSGHRFGAPDRHGKWLLLPTDGPTLLVHSGMTGRPHFVHDGGWDRYDRLVVRLDRGELHYADQRKLRGVWLACGPDEVASVLGEQGPDALDVDGNLLVDEICWRARVAPALPVRELDDAALRRLHQAMKRVLATAVRHGCVPGLPRWLTGVRDDPDPSCPRCGTRLRRARIGGRASLWCPHCQQR